jgi:hypothetical protein
VSKQLREHLTSEWVEERILEAQCRVAPEDYYHDIAHLAADILKQLDLRGDNRKMADLLLDELKVRR